MSTLDETRIATLVDRFYDKVQADPAIGPIFNAAVHDWPEHKRLLTSFWCSVALRAASYRGNPMAVHRGQPAIRAEHFVRWLQLWRETTLEMLDADDAATMLDYAERIGRSLRMGMGLPDRLDVRPFGIPVVGVGKA
ncbi:MAG: preprotein translocase subunit TatC [Rhodanobacter sp. 68-29]|uniref:group III truncated hemoglobin n=1 Tax=Rhodanobacter sp. PCA2 TaxID=2006117 RepID=UPI00086C20AB|nr:group III truncated hemoglobin [Rhodanobacter sp. PCA2]MBA2077384.1 preprotein translocase subunit TatC [Rhodanobacter sp. PCA2]MBN8923550.1 group III truncated hemoglobin [Rhodanobacter sp.]ODU74048.1 MAG: preprotein translocase subunit TatC [Rhodanobacter sp. SCN 69-32]OJY55405.1 MAG: preprotein translocase subunit TatC [Rhodanobacter sp. 68-29]